MTRRRYSKAVLGSISEKGDVPGLLFRHGKTQKAARVFMRWIRDKPLIRARPSEISQFTRDLQSGEIRRDFKYSRRSFYSLVLRRLMELGFIEIVQHRSPFYKPVWQPIPKRAPGGHNWWNLSHLIAKFGDDYRHYMQRVPRMNLVLGILRFVKRRREN